MAIPIIGVPIVNGANWLDRLVKSIDFPVNNLFIVNNNGRGQIDAALEKIKEEGNEYVSKIKIVHLPANIGCAGAWNLIIKCYMMQPYWVICNHDIAFTPGLLAELYEKMLDENCMKIGGGTYGTAWDLFALRAAVVQRVGLFDENIYPAYCEDIDYGIRMGRQGIKADKFKNKHFHGPLLDSYSEGSRTWRDSPDIAQKIFDAHHMNKAYMNAKWGDKWEDHIKGPYHKMPFNFSFCPDDYQPFDLNFIKSKNLGF